MTEYEWAPLLSASVVQNETWMTECRCGLGCAVCGRTGEQRRRPPSSGSRLPSPGEQTPQSRRLHREPRCKRRWLLLRFCFARSTGIAVATFANHGYFCNAASALSPRSWLYCRGRGRTTGSMARSATVHGVHKMCDMNTFLHPFLHTLRYEGRDSHSALCPRRSLACWSPAMVHTQLPSGREKCEGEAGRRGESVKGTA